MSSDTQQPNPNAPGLPVVGERRHFYFNDAGQPAYQVFDLTAEDFLNPLPDDQFAHGELHDNYVRALATMLHHHFRYSPTTSVHARAKLIWPDTTLDRPMPDVAIVDNLADQHRHRPTLDLAAEQAAVGDENIVGVRAIFEVTSPHLAEVDLTTKRHLYARAGVAEYWIIDTGLRPTQDTPRVTITGLYLEGDRYKPIEPAAAGRCESRACRLWLKPTDDGQNFEIGDLRTGKPLPPPSVDDDPSISAQAEANRRAQSIADQLKL